MMKLSGESRQCGAGQGAAGLAVLWQTGPRRRAAVLSPELCGHAGGRDGRLPQGH